MRLEETDTDEWSQALPDSGFGVFHTTPALDVLDDHTTATRKLLGAFKGQEPVGLVPVFVESKAGGRVVTSPPPGLTVPRLGPLVMPTSPKQRKRESVTREFVDLVLDAVDADSRRSLVRFVCPTTFTDPRPFQWADMAVEPSFTYILDLEQGDADSIKQGFSRDFRRSIHTGLESAVTVTVEGPETAGRIYDHVDARYAEQDQSFPPSREYVCDLVAALGDRSRVYVARDESGDYLGGIIALYSNDMVSFWQGGVRTANEEASVNDLLHWTIITDALEGEPHEVSGYDLVGANTPRLCRYKSKFSADLVPYHTVESSGAEMSVAKRAYSLVNR